MPHSIPSKRTKEKKNFRKNFSRSSSSLLSSNRVLLSDYPLPSFPLDDKSRNGWQASTSLIRGTPVVTVSSSHRGAPSFFRPLFLARGYIRGPDAKVCAAHFNELAIPSCFPAVWVSTAEGRRRRLPRGGAGVAVASQAEGETVERTGTGNGCEVAPAGAPRRPRRGSSWYH